MGSRHLFPTYILNILNILNILTFSFSSGIYFLPKPLNVKAGDILTIGVAALDDRLSFVVDTEESLAEMANAEEGRDMPVVMNQAGPGGLHGKLLKGETNPNPNPNWRPTWEASQGGD